MKILIHLSHFCPTRLGACSKGLNLSIPSSPPGNCVFMSWGVVTWGVKIILVGASWWWTFLGLVQCNYGLQLRGGQLVNTIFLTWTRLYTVYDIDLNYLSKCVFYWGEVSCQTDGWRQRN